ncbi:EF-hand domain-containing protein [Nitrosospira multiformis]|uniref:EF-hand domain-containing protein n=1 Tax=Nitrosospira multiformis TaxID=1231 RepID=UPI00089BA636|nr:EF-hand domain-containing protein [Nitrosospira multiformis]SEA31206.1 EF hand [Nitrosospira multiformis]
MKNHHISGSLGISLIIVAFALPALVLAEAPPGRKPDAREVIMPPWELYDADEDGYITMKEAAVQKMSPQVFHSLDIDRDGRLNRNEFTKAPPIEEK